ncbi:hypothetical protein [uncultured Cellulomonas sp.]|uniref:hypothetical protein n=1 Tax=uncultured Cellulomonas sp. TaxID=189682 RepID=UPI0028E4398E|nr:hypothetical protein [uncultured Cellulomonas sp.]
MTSDNPWQLPAAGDVPQTLFGGVRVVQRIERERVVEALRSAVAMVQACIGVDVTWWTSTATDQDGPDATAQDLMRPGLDWAFVHDRPGAASWIALSGASTSLLGHPGHPQREVAHVVARFPEHVLALGADVGSTSVAVSVQRWAMYGSGEDLRRVAAPLSDWMLQTAVSLGCDTGYAILDTVDAFDPASAWQRRTGLAVGTEEDATGLWGYGWATLLSDHHVDRAGGLDVLSAIAGAEVRDVPGRRAWVSLGDDPAAVPDAALHALHATLLPAFPDGDPEPHAAVLPPSVADVTSRWRADVAAARAAGRTVGAFGPVGFTLDAGVPALVVPHVEWVGPDLDFLPFTGLGADAAGALLDRLDAGVLDVRTGAGPTLRTALRAAVAHPGVVLLTGHVVGPGRDDERLTVEGAHLHDPVLAGLDRAAVAAAWQRVVALGLDDALGSPDELRAPTEDEPDAWTVWWD